MSHFFALDILIVLLKIPESVLLSVVSLTGCCICPNSSRVFMYCTASPALRKSDSLYDSDAELITDFITLARTYIGPLNRIGTIHCRMEQRKALSLRLLHKTPSKYTPQKCTTYL